MERETTRGEDKDEERKDRLPPASDSHAARRARGREGKTYPLVWAHELEQQSAEEEEE